MNDLKNEIYSYIILTDVIIVNKHYVDAKAFEIGAVGLTFCVVSLLLKQRNLQNN